MDRDAQRTLLAAINAPDGPALTALAGLNAPPRTRVAQAGETVPGWRGFGHVRRIAIVVNGLLMVLLVGVVLLFLSEPDGQGAQWLLLLAAPSLLSVLGLWPCRTWRPLRALMLLANLAWFGAVLWFTAMMFITVRTSYLIEAEAGTLDADNVKIIGGILLVGLLPPGTALWAQLQGWLRG